MKRESFIWAGRRAEKLVAEWGITTLPINVEAIAREREILVEPMPSNIRGVSGMLQKVGNHFGIAYATFVDNPGFQRFSIAHELAHYFLEGHPEALLTSGPHRSRAGFGSGDKHEMEADYFASGLLMPNPLFARALDKAGSGFRAIERLAGLCGTSLESTAIKFAQTTDAPVAIIVSEGATIAYWFASVAFKASGVDWIAKNTPLPDCATRAFNAKPERVAAGERVEASTGLREWFGDGSDWEIAEDVVGLGSYGKTLTVLFGEDWPDPGDNEDNDEDEPRFRQSRRR